MNKKITTFFWQGVGLKTRTSYVDFGEKLPLGIRWKRYINIHHHSAWLSSPVITL